MHNISKYIIHFKKVVQNMAKVNSGLIITQTEFLRTNKVKRADLFIGDFAVHAA